MPGIFRWPEWGRKETVYSADGTVQKSVSSSMWRKVWSGGLVGGAVFFLWGGGITLTTSRLYSAADVCYLIGGILSLLKFLTWEEHQDKPLTKRIPQSIIGSIFICLIDHWQRESSVIPQAGQI